MALALGLLGLESGSALAAGYADIVAWAYAPDQVPTWVPRLALLASGSLAVVLATAALWSAYLAPRRHAGGALWRLLGAPVDSRAFAALATGALWDLLRGGAKLARPEAQDLSQRYAELLTSSLGQPGHRDLLLAVHDLDARRDLVFGLVGGEAGKRQFPGSSGPSARRAEAFDLGADGRGLLVDVLAAAATLPAASEPHAMRFPVDGYWRGEVAPRHRSAGAADAPARGGRRGRRRAGPRRHRDPRGRRAARTHGRQRRCPRARPASGWPARKRRRCATPCASRTRTSTPCS